MAYSSNRLCPAEYPEHYPQLQMRLNYEVKDARTLQFACLPTSPGCVDGKAPYYTVHSDFWNHWDPAELARLVKTI
jgi:hypothetical protein